jgi:hypothetical protein
MRSRGIESAKSSGSIAISIQCELVEWVTADILVSISKKVCPSCPVRDVSVAHYISFYWNSCEISFCVYVSTT